MTKPNGCGPWWLPDHYKDDYFKQACDEHDQDYENGVPRKRADDKFYRMMQARIAVEPEWKVRTARKYQALWYYRLVRVFGWMLHKKRLKSKEK